MSNIEKWPLEGEHVSGDEVEVVRPQVANRDGMAWEEGIVYGASEERRGRLVIREVEFSVELGESTINPSDQQK
jgi:hypothetical protein